MRIGLAMPREIANQIEHILVDLHRRTGAECILLTDVSGQLVSVHGQTQEIDPALVAALAAGDVAAMAELARLIGEGNPHGSFLHEGENRSVYLFNVAGILILIVIFQADIPVGLIRLFVRRAAERLYPLTDEFEELVRHSTQVSNVDFGVTLVKELDRAFEGL